MLKRKLLTAGLLMAATTTASAIPYGFFDARSVGMGNTSVATGGLTTAAFSNPAMLSINESDETFALLLPAVGVQVIDNGGMIDLIDDYQVAQAASDTTGMINALNQLQNTSAVVGANVNAALVYSGDSFSFAASYTGNGFLSAGITNVNTTAVPPTADLTALAIVAPEIGFSVATKLSIAGMELAVGVRPKIVSVEAIDYSLQINPLTDVADILDGTTEDLGSFTSLDAGAVLQVSDSISIGVLARNLMEETKTTLSGTKVNFNKLLRAGVAYHNSFLTAAVDMDLTESDPVFTFDEKTKMLTAGIELNAWDFLQFRVGYQTNMASNAVNPDLISAGVGLWLGFNLDIAVVAGEDSLGAFVQTGFRF